MFDTITSYQHEKEEFMMHDGRFASLLARKAQIEGELQREMNVPMPDQVRLSTLKRRKLMVKDEISRLSDA